MKITNFKEKYIRVESDYLADFVANPSGFSKIDITSKQGCNGTPVTKTINSEDIELNTWLIELTEAVSLNNTIYQLIVKNNYSLREWNVIATPIALSYVADNCTSPSNDCTLQSFDTHFAPLFKTEIDNWFDSIGVTTDVTIEFQGNVLLVKGVPPNFGFTQVKYSNADAEPYNEAFFSFGALTTFALITDEALYISPSFFGDSSLQDGVYEVLLKYTKTGNTGFISEVTCAFIDVSTRCQVASYLNALIEGAFSENATNIMLLHYGLLTGSNCGCNCADLCTVYDELLELLLANPTNPQNDDCGC